MKISGWVGATFLLAVTFAAGAIAGAGYMRHHAPPPETSMMAAHHVLMKLHDELHLDSAQREAMTRILARHQSTVDSSWQSMQPRVRAAIDSTLQEMMTVLRPDQVEKFRALMQQLHPGAIHLP